MEKNRIVVYIDTELVEKLKYLHKREGPMNHITKKRKPFSIFISNILWDHASERMILIKAMKEGGDWKDEDFE